MDISWIVRVALAKPATSMRGLAITCRDFFGEDSNTPCSRPTMSKIRDAFVEVVKDISASELAAAIRVLSAASSNIGQPRCFLTITMLHVQDEADMRLRSELPDNFDCKTPSRSRSSKVQNHIVTVHLPQGAKLTVPVELDALADKTSRTLATSFYAVVRNVSKIVLGAVGNTSAAWFFVHILVGDGIASNARAARLLWAMSTLAPPVDARMTYLLLVVVCATHIANLVAKDITIGYTAKLGIVNTAAARAAGEGVDASSMKNSLPACMAPACVRLYKYLCCQYYEEFLSQLKVHCATLEIIPPDGAGGESHPTVALLADLYTAHVVPGGLSKTLNMGFGVWKHKVPHYATEDYFSCPSAYKDRISA